MATQKTNKVDDSEESYFGWFEIGLFIATLLVGALLISFASMGVVPSNRVSVACEGSLSEAYHPITFTTEKFLLDTTKEEPITTIPADPSYKKVEKHDEVDASCPASIIYNGERYELTYVDPATNQVTTVVAPKEFVTFEKIGENETPSVEITTMSAADSGGKYYGNLIKKSKTDSERIQINKYVVRS